MLTDESPRTRTGEPEIRERLRGEPRADADVYPDFKLLVDIDYCTISKEIVSLRDSMTSVTSKGALSDEAIMGIITSVTPDKLNISEIRLTWGKLALADNIINTKTAAARVLTALSLKAHSDIWSWFSNHVTCPVLGLEERRKSQRSNQMEMPNQWIFPLFDAIRKQLAVKKAVDLKAADFFEGLDAPDYKSSGGRMSILHHVERALFSWLDFQPRPGMILDTSRAVANFITTASRTFKNMNFLYLHCVQSRIETLCASLTVERIELKKIPWERFAEVLADHPLADPSSDEAVGLARLKDMLWISSGLPTPDNVPEDTVRLVEEYKRVSRFQGDPGVESSSIEAFLRQTWVLTWPLLQRCILIYLLGYLRLTISELR